MVIKYKNYRRFTSDVRLLGTEEIKEGQPASGGKPASGEKKKDETKIKDVDKPKQRQRP